MLRCLVLVWLLCGVAGVAAAAEDLEFRAPAIADGAATASAMRSLAVRALPVYENPDRTQFLTNLSALQMVAGEYTAADATRQSLHEVRRRERTARQVDEALIYDLYGEARALSAKSHVPFDRAFAQVFHEAVSPLGDQQAYTVTEWLQTPLSVFQGNLQRELDRLRGRSRISLSEAVDLAWTYLSFEAFQSFGPVIGPLVAQDDQKRYIIADDVLVHTHQKASVSAVVIRPRNVSMPLPALLEFTLHVDPSNDAKDSAAHGYVGVVAYARDRAGSPDALAPYQHDGDDARAVIGWIAAQPWSDGRVGMYGSGYSAFAAWAAAKRPPPALKALAASSVVAPGLDSPDRMHIEAMPEAPHPRGLERPGLGKDWQKIIPYQKDFARIDLPVLTTTGYYDQDEIGSLYFFMQDARYNPHADQTLLLGPYDSHTMQHGPLPVLAGYPVDPAAIVDLHELRYQWFDHVLKGAPVPQLLDDHVNFEVMGADEWRHAASLPAMANGAVRLYLDDTRVAGHYGLTGHEPSSKHFVEETIGAAGQGGAPEPLTAIMARTLGPRDGVEFVSGPLHRPLQVSGRIAGRLVFTAPGGLALHIAVYELRASGEYFQVFAPPAEACAPARAPHRLSRHDGPQQLELRSDRLTSVELHTGSRIVLVLDADQAHAGKHSPHAVKRKSARSRSAAQKTPRVRWYGGSFIELPIWR